MSTGDPPLRFRVIIAAAIVLVCGFVALDRSRSPTAAATDPDERGVAGRNEPPMLDTGAPAPPLVDQMFQVEVAEEQSLGASQLVALHVRDLASGDPIPYLALELGAAEAGSPQGTHAPGAVSPSRVQADADGVLQLEVGQSLSSVVAEDGWRLCSVKWDGVRRGNTLWFARERGVSVSVSRSDDPVALTRLECDNVKLRLRMLGAGTVLPVTPAPWGPYHARALGFDGRSLEFAVATAPVLQATVPVSRWSALEVSYPGYYPGFIDLEWPIAEGVPIAVVLEPRVVLTGLVKDASTGQPIPGVRIQVISHIEELSPDFSSERLRRFQRGGVVCVGNAGGHKEWCLVESALTSSSGEFTVPTRTRAQYYVRVVSGKHAPWTGWVDPEKLQDGDLDISLEPRAEQTQFLLEGVPLAGALLNTIEHPDPATGMELPQANYTIKLDDRGFADRSVFASGRWYRLVVRGPGLPAQRRLGWLQWKDADRVELGYLPASRPER